jgi:hypothetical protein
MKSFESGVPPHGGSLPGNQRPDNPAPRTLHECIQELSARMASIIEVVLALKRTQETDLRQLQAAELNRVVIDPVLRLVGGAINELRAAQNAFLPSGDGKVWSAEEATRIALSTLTSIEARFLEMIDNHAVEEYWPAPGGLFDAHTQTRVLAESRPTDDTNLQAHIAATRSAGFRRGETVLVKPRVVLFDVRPKKSDSK